MGFLPPINLGSFKPSPATLAQWVYDIWQYLQENPIATQEDIATYIQNYFETSPEVQEIVGEVVAQYLLDNPPQAPVQSVQGKTGAVTLNYPDIVPASNAVPVYRAASAPNTSTAQGLYNNGYRLFVNTATQEIYTISNSGALALVGRGRFDGTTVDLDTAQGDTTISEAVDELDSRIDTAETSLAVLNNSVPKPGDTFGTATSPFSCMVYALVTGAGKEIWLSIPVSLWCDTTIDLDPSAVKFFHAALRMPAGGYIVGNMVDLSSYVTQLQLRSKGRGFFMTLTNNDGWGAVNNSCVTGSCQIAITF